MLLFLVRHAHALTEAENPVRPLSPRGRGEVGRLARFFAGNGCFAPAQVWHSPLARSRETTDELLRRLALDPVVVETPGLLPEDDPQATADRLAMHPTDRGDLALIGHEPHLSALAALLVQGKASADVVRMRKAAALALEPTGDVHKKTGLARWRVRWHVAPELLPAVTVALPAQNPSALVINSPSPAS